MNNSAYNLTQYDKIMKFTNLSDYDGVFSPFTQAWIPAWGGWAWVMAIVLTTGVVYIKFKEIFPAAIVMLILSAVLISSVPDEVEPVLYLMMVLGVLGSMYGWFEDRGY